MKSSIFDKLLAATMVLILVMIVLNFFDIQGGDFLWLVFAFGFAGVWCVGIFELRSASRRMLELSHRPDAENQSESKQ